MKYHAGLFFQGSASRARRWTRVTLSIYGALCVYLFCGTACYLSFEWGNTAQAQAKAMEIKIPPLPLRGVESLAPTLDPKTFPKELQKSATLISEKKFEDAIQALPSSVNGRTRPELALPRMFLLSVAKFGQQDFSAALKAALSGLSIRGSDSDILYLKALSQLRLSKPTEAISSLEEAVWFERFTRVSAEEFYYSLAVAYSLLTPEETSKTGTAGKEETRVKKIENALNTSLARNSAFAPARIQLARIYVIQGNRLGAIRVLKDGVAADPESKELKLGLADALITNVDRVMNKDEISQALKTTSDLFQSTKPGDPSYREIVPVHVRALLAAGKASEAEKALSKALKSNPTDATFIALKRQVAIEKQAENKSARSLEAPVS